jgi:hypothetical protein
MAACTAVASRGRAGFAQVTFPDAFPQHYSRDDSCENNRQQQDLSRVSKMRCQRCKVAKVTRLPKFLQRSRLPDDLLSTTRVGGSIPKGVEVSPEPERLKYFVYELLIWPLSPRNTRLRTLPSIGLHASDLRSMRGPVCSPQRKPHTGSLRRRIFLKNSLRATPHASDV